MKAIGPIITLMLVLPEDVLIEMILSHLHVADIVSLRKIKNFYKVIAENEKYIDTICQHICPHGILNAYVNSRIATATTYKDGVKHGLYKEYNALGDIVKYVNYKNGLEDGEYVQIFKNDTIKITNYTRGQYNGLCREVYSNGQLAYQLNFINGRATGPCIEWYSTGRLKSEHFYVNGYLHGSFKKWYSTGQLKCYHKYSNGYKHADSWDYSNDSRRWNLDMHN